jgi:hypothetical protein
MDCRKSSKCGAIRAMTSKAFSRKISF